MRRLYDDTGAEVDLAPKPPLRSQTGGHEEEWLATIMDSTLSAQISSGSGLAGARILIIDDLAPNVLLLERTLKQAGATELRSTTDAREALPIFLDFDPDLVLLDLRMPHASGFSVLQLLNEATPADAFVPVIVLTGDTTFESKERALAQGAHDFLTKPFHRTEVLLRIENLLATRRLHQRLQAHNSRLAEELSQRVEREQRAAEHRRWRLERMHPLLAGMGLRAVFQPVIDLSSRLLVGVEALARFDSEPQWTPDRWFTEASDLGVGVELELMAVKTALAGLDELPPDTYLAINASPATVMSGRLMDVVSAVPGKRLVLELTEEASVANYEALASALEELRARGIRLALDDAGAGYAGLQRILRLAPDIIKLDLGLTRNIESDRARRALVSALVAFAGEMGATITAEGIESSAALAVLKELGVDCGQGFHLARPGPLPLLDFSQFRISSTQR